MNQISVRKLDGSRGAVNPRAFIPDNYKPSNKCPWLRVLLDGESAYILANNQAYKIRAELITAIENAKNELVCIGWDGNLPYFVANDRQKIEYIE